MGKRKEGGGLFLPPLVIPQTVPASTSGKEASAKREGGKKRGEGRKKRKRRERDRGRMNGAGGLKCILAPPSKRAQEKGEGGRLVVQWMR